MQKFWFVWRLILRLHSNQTNERFKDLFAHVKNMSIFNGILNKACYMKPQ